MKRTKMKKKFSDKKTISRNNTAKRAKMKQKLQEEWSDLMDSKQKKLSKGASEYSRAMRSRGGSNSKISGRELEKGSRKASSFSVKKINKQKTKAARRKYS